MKVTIHKHFDYQTPFSEAGNDDELEHIMRLKYPKACSMLEVDAGFFANMVEEVRQFKAWRVVGFSNFEDFCRDELGKTLDEVTTIVEGVKQLQKRGVEKPTLADVVAIAEEQGKLPAHGEIGGGHGRDDNVKSASIQGGNDSTYLTRRLMRDRPDLFERLKAGEFKSVRAAAIEAGIVKVPTVLQQFMRLWKKASPTERQQIQEIAGL